MKIDTVPLAVRDFIGLVGREDTLPVVHGAILRAAQSIRHVVESGAMLAACSDEFNGELRAAFAVDVARMLHAPNVPGTRRVFSISNLGGRIEPGAVTLANVHFTALSANEGEKLLLIEIAGHVGRRETAEGNLWGDLDRFGTPSPCCGALQLLLDVPPSAGAVRFPWFDQLNAFFGPERLSALRADKSPFRMLRAAIVHAVLQTESAIVDLLREPPPTRTHVLLATIAVVNRRGTDNAIPVGLHHLRFEAGVPVIEFGVSLRSTPASLSVDASQSNVRVSSPFAEEPWRPRPSLHSPSPVVPPLQRMQARAEAVQARVAQTRQHLVALRPYPATLRIYARPMLRAFVQGVSVVAPQVALTAFAMESSHEFFGSTRVHELLARAPSIEEARKILHDLEPSLQQIGHNEARDVLESMLAQDNPLFGSQGA